MGDGVLEFGSGDVDSVGDRFRRTIARGAGDDVGRLGTVARDQRGRQVGRRAQRGHRVGRRAHQRQVAGPARGRGQPAQRDGPVEHVLGHVPVFGQLAADDADDAVVGLRRRRVRATRRQCSAPVARSCPRPLRVDERPQAGVRPDDVVGSERDVECGVDGVEQERDLLRRRLRHVGNGTGRILVGEPEIDAAELLGHGEHEAVELTGNRNRQRGSGIAECRRVEHQVRAAAGPQS